MFHNSEVSETLYIEFRQMERKNRNLQQSDQRHNEFSELTDETLGRRSRFVPKSVDEIIIEMERPNYFNRQLLNCQTFNGGVSCCTMSTTATITKSEQKNIALHNQQDNLLYVQEKK